MGKKNIILTVLQQTSQIYHNFDNNKKDISDNNQKDKSYLSGKLDYTAITKDIARDSTDTPTKESYRELFTSESLLLLKEKWFTKSEFPTNIFISNIRYSYSGSQYNNCFYLFHD